MDPTNHNAQSRDKSSESTVSSTNNSPAHGSVRRQGTEEVCPVWDEERQAFVWAYTMQGAARELGITQRELRQLLHSGQLPEYRKSHQKGRRVFILKADIERYQGKPPTDPIAYI